MKKVLLSALMAGTLVLPLANAEAGELLDAYRTKRNSEVSAEAMAETKVAARKSVAVGERSTKVAISSTASARTDRSLLAKEAPRSIVLGVSQVNEPAAAALNEYKMRSGDQLQIVVYGHDDLSTRPGVSYTPYVVRPDGNLAVPLIGDVYCAGRSVPEVTLEISNRLAEYIIDPQVTINVTKLGTTRVYVLGEVYRQGSYELEKSHNLLDAVGAANGFNQKSAKNKVYVIRKGEQNVALKINMLDLLRNGDTSKNVELNEGDCVYISSNHKIGLQAILSGVYSFVSAWENADDIRK